MATVQPTGCAVCGKAALINLSAEISVLAEQFASSSASSVGFDESILWLDLYMMYYRIEYKRLYDARLITIICGCDSLGSLCCSLSAGEEEEAEAEEAEAEEEKFNFDLPLEFCFHTGDFDLQCVNCASKQAREKS